MMGNYIEQRLEELVGHTCRVETRDGSIRNEHIAGIEYLELQVDGETSKMPVGLKFDDRGLDGAELRMVAKIDKVQDQTA